MNDNPYTWPDLPADSDEARTERLRAIDDDPYDYRRVRGFGFVEDAPSASDLAADERGD